MAKPTQIVTGHEQTQHAVRQWSGLAAELVAGWGCLGGGAMAIVDPAIVPPFVLSHPLAFFAAGLALLSGRSAALLLKKFLDVAL